MKSHNSNGKWHYLGSRYCVSVCVCARVCINNRDRLLKSKADLSVQKETKHENV